MTRRKVFAALVALGATAILAAVTGFTSNQNAFSGTIYFGMDAPLTGATELVGQSDRQTVQAVVAYWNSRGGIKGRRVVANATRVKVAPQHHLWRAPQRQFTERVSSSELARRVSVSNPRRP